MCQSALTRREGVFTFSESNPILLTTKSDESHSFYLW